MTTNSVVAPNVSSSAAGPKRYHPALVILHWLITILIFGSFFLAQSNEGDRERFRPGQGNISPQGFLQGNPPRNLQAGQDPPQEGVPPQAASQNIFSAIGWHMIFGISVLILLIIRLAVRLTTKHPDWASAGNRFFDWVGNLTHLGLYLLTFAMAITGILLANQRGILARVFGIGSTPTPGTYLPGGFRFGMLHEGVWILLIILIILHIGAALYHQFILKDNLMGRMWFGRSAE